MYKIFGELFKDGKGYEKFLQKRLDINVKML